MSAHEVVKLVLDLGLFVIALVGLCHTIFSRDKK